MIVRQISLAWYFERYCEKLNFLTLNLNQAVVPASKQV